MQILINGHRYELDHLDGDGTTIIQFVDRGHGRNTEGILNQDLLRVLIDRMKVLDSEVPWEGNAKIIEHLRRALLLHEVRTLERKLERGEFEPEACWISPDDGHWRLYEA